jgi:hypothetical protein
MVNGRTRGLSNYSGARADQSTVSDGSRHQHPVHAASIAQINLYALNLTKRAHRFQEVLFTSDAATLVATERQTKATAVHGIEGGKAGFEKCRHSMCATEIAGPHRCGQTIVE